jgi:hypothetical protein
VMSGRCLAGEDQRGCWNLIRWFAPRGKRDSTSWTCDVGGRMSGPKGLCQRWLAGIACTTAPDSWLACLVPRQASSPPACVHGRSPSVVESRR